MKIIRYFCLIGLLLAVMFFVPSKGWTLPKPGTHAPIITSTFAVDKAYYGYIWKIYIEAEDPDGDMLRIASVAEQPGFGRYSTDWIYLKPQYQKHFKGYIQWNTFGSYAFYLREWTQITLTVSIYDKAGNESNEVVFPFTFESGMKDPYKYKLPPPFDQGDLPRLGYIDINLFDAFPTAAAGFRTGD
jgi:hypothetical protein